MRPTPASLLDAPPVGKDGRGVERRGEGETRGERGVGKGGRRRGEWRKRQKSAHSKQLHVWKVYFVSESRATEGTCGACTWVAKSWRSCSPITDGASLSLHSHSLSSPFLLQNHNENNLPELLPRLQSHRPSRCQRPVESQPWLGRSKAMKEFVA